MIGLFEDADPVGKDLYQQIGGLIVLQVVVLQQPLEFGASDAALVVIETRPVRLGS